jgi:hypothetical protein
MVLIQAFVSGFEMTNTIPRNSRLALSRYCSAAELPV